MLVVGALAVVGGQSGEKLVGCLCHEGRIVGAEVMEEVEEVGEGA